MNWRIIESNWNRLKGQAKRRWGKLTDDDLMEIAGNRDQLVGKLQQYYDMTSEEVERDIDKWSRGQLPDLESTAHPDTRI